jgi:hypothetical protein
VGETTQGIYLVTRSAVARRPELNHELVKYRPVASSSFFGSDVRVLQFIVSSYRWTIFS